jgi:hypothetical protein
VGSRLYYTGDDGIHLELICVETLFKSIFYNQWNDQEARQIKYAFKLSRINLKHYSSSLCLPFRSPKSISTGTQIENELSCPGQERERDRMDRWQEG